MPYKPKQPCKQPGCPTLVDKGYCEEHSRVRNREYDARRGSPSKRGYGRRWQKKRNRILRRDPFCKCKLKQCGHAPGKCGAFSTDVDHKVSRRRGGTDSDENLEGTCHICHSRKTAIIDSRWGKR